MIRHVLNLLLVIRFYSVTSRSDQFHQIFRGHFAVVTVQDMFDHPDFLDVAGRFEVINQILPNITSEPVMEGLQQKVHAHSVLYLAKILTFNGPFDPLSTLLHVLLPVL
jgi:hypothetical protein